MIVIGISSDHEAHDCSLVYMPSREERTGEYIVYMTCNGVLLRC